MSDPNRTEIPAGTKKTGTMSAKRVRNLVFGIVLAAILLAGTVHTAVAYASIARDRYTSAPAEIALFLLIPYGAAAAAEGGVWGIAAAVDAAKRKHAGEEEDRGNGEGERTPR